MSCWSSSSGDNFSASRTEIYFYSAPRAETRALQATVSSFRSFRELCDATWHLLSVFVRSVFSFRKKMRLDSWPGLAGRTA